MPKKYDIWEMGLTDEQRQMTYDRMGLIFKTWSLLPDTEIKKSYREDLLDAGYRGLCLAIAKFDPSKGKALKSYCIQYIKSCMHRELGKLTGRSRKIINIDDPIKDDRDGKERTVAETVEDPNVDVERQGIINAEAAVIEQIMYKVCDEHEIEVLDKYVNGFMTYEEVGEVLGTSRQRIGQIVSKARKKILAEYKKIEKGESNCLTNKEDSDIMKVQN